MVLPPLSCARSSASLARRPHAGGEAGGREMRISWRQQREGRGRDGGPAHEEGNAMSIESLGYLGLKVKDPRQWSEFATRVLGLMPAEGDAASPRFRLDAQAWRIAV